MGDWINFAEIRARVSLEDVLLRYYRLTNLRREGDKLIGPCPVHQGDSKTAFHATLSKNLWHCFTRCKRGGNQLDLVAAKDGLAIRDAAIRLRDSFLGGRPPSLAAPAPSTPLHSASANLPPMAAPTPAPSSPPPAVANDEGDGNRPLDVRLVLRPNHPHLLQDRGLQLSTVEHFGLGYCGRGILRGMIAIPIHDEEGRLVAYAGRRLKPQDVRELGKYRLPRGLKKDRLLYNYHRARKAMAEQGLVLVEGFFSVVKLHEYGLTNAVAAMGSQVSEHQAKLLTAAIDVTIIFDGDEAGRAGALAARDLLAPHVPVQLIHLPNGAEPETLAPKALRWAVNGARQLGLAEVTIRLRPPSSPPTT